MADRIKTKSKSTQKLDLQIKPFIVVLTKAINLSISMLQIFPISILTLDKQCKKAQMRVCGLKKNYQKHYRPSYRKNVSKQRLLKDGWLVKKMWDIQGVFLQRMWIFEDKVKDI